MSFNQFNLHDSVVEGLTSMGYEKPTPIQEQVIPIIMEGHDAIACAQTGTGKTAAYLLPVLHQAAVAKNTGVDTLIIAPTRELAVQIDEQIMGLGYFAGATSIPIYGGGDGGDFVSQKNAIKEGADIIVATPGKLLTHLNMEYADFSKLRHLILDEADRMLDMGFFDDIARIIGFLPEKRQSLLFSATMPPKIRQLAKKILHNPKEVNIAISKPAEGVLQAAYLVHNHQKIGLIKHLLKEKQDTYKSIIIFASTKLNVKELHRELVRNKMGAKAIHSDLDQNEREAVLNSFRNREFQVLVATDILSRGIDIKEISLIINYDVPHDAEDYVHRVGRTARAESTGVALTFINEKDVWRFQKIEQLLEKEVNKVPLPEHLGEGPKYEKKKAPRFNKGRNFRKGSGGRPGGRSGGRNKRR